MPIEDTYINKKHIFIWCFRTKKIEAWRCFLSANYIFNSSRGKEIFPILRSHWTWSGNFI